MLCQDSSGAARLSRHPAPPLLLASWEPREWGRGAASAKTPGAVPGGREARGSPSGNYPYPYLLILIRPRSRSGRLRGGSAPQAAPDGAVMAPAPLPGVPAPHPALLPAAKGPLVLSPAPTLCPALPAAAPAAFPRPLAAALSSFAFSRAAGASSCQPDAALKPPAAAPETGDGRWK